MRNRLAQRLLERVRAAAADATPLRLCGGAAKIFMVWPWRAPPWSCARCAASSATSRPSWSSPPAPARPLQELQATLAQAGQTLAFEPRTLPWRRAAHRGRHGGCPGGPAPRGPAAARCAISCWAWKSSTAGRAAALRRPSYEKRRWLRCLRLMAGSWGTLGVITEVSLKVAARGPGASHLGLCHGRGAGPGGTEPLGRPAPAAERQLLGAGPAVAAPVRCPGRRAGRLPKNWAASACPTTRPRPCGTACASSSTPGLPSAAMPMRCGRLSLPQTAAPLALPEGIAAPLIEWHGAQRWVQAPRTMASAITAAAQAAGGSATIFRAERADQLSNWPNL